jgi:NAD(P)-dependent dehydrogenase (short-subunit alcohol dehydrogenase family)
MPVDTSPVPDYPGKLRLDGKGFLILGAGQGIGRQTTHALASAGARVFCVDRDSELANAVAGEVDGTAWTGDVTIREDVERMTADAERELGAINGFVDIVGMARWRDLFDMTDEDLSWQFDIVLRHALLAAQVCGRRMAAGNGGSMVFIASVSGITGAPHHAAYGAAKAALMSLVRSLAVELGPVGIRANAIAPGVVWTPRVSGLLGDRGRDAHIECTPLGRVGLSDDIASVALFLSSELAGFVSGQTLTVDGAATQRFPYPPADQFATVGSGSPA